MGVEHVRRPAWNVANVIIMLQHAKYMHVGPLPTHTREWLETKKPEEYHMLRLSLHYQTILGPAALQRLVHKSTRSMFQQIPLSSIQYQYTCKAAIC